MKHSWIGKVCLLAVVFSLGGLLHATPESRQAVVPVYSSDFSKLMWYQAELHGFPPQQMPGNSGEPWGTQNWSSPDQYLTWDVSVAQAGKYAVSILYLCAGGLGRIGVRDAGRRVITGVQGRGDTRMLTKAYGRL